MNKSKLNCEKAKRIDLILYLKKLNIEVAKTTSKEVWFFSPFKDEKTASFKVNIIKNIWMDFSEGVGGTIIDFIMKYNNCSISEALQILSNNVFSIHQQPKKIKHETSPTYSIKKVTELTNYNLLDYLKSRKINLDYAKKFCCQVHYSFESKKEIYAIGFMNDKGGFEIRNKYTKICLGKKAITTIKNQSKTVCVFESWSDFLSYLTLKNEIPNEDFIILNSTSLMKTIYKKIENYNLIKTFLDNDDTGKKATKLLIDNTKKQVVDNSIHYKNFNDLNDYLINRNQKIRSVNEHDNLCE